MWLRSLTDERPLPLFTIGCGNVEIRRNISSLLMLKLFNTSAVFESFIFRTVLITLSLPNRSGVERIDRKMNGKKKNNTIKWKLNTFCHFLWSMKKKLLNRGNILKMKPKVIENSQTIIQKTYNIKYWNNCSDFRGRINWHLPHSSNVDPLTINAPENLLWWVRLSTLARLHTSPAQWAAIHRQRKQ